MGQMAFWSEYILPICALTRVDNGKGAYRQGARRQWAVPQRVVLPPFRWLTHGISAQFSERVIKLVLQHHPDALDDDPPP
jgi:hypothetical protein